MSARFLVHRSFRAVAGGLVCKIVAATWDTVILDDSTRLITHAQFHFEQHLRSFLHSKNS